MKIYSQNDNYKLYQGSMLDMLEVIEPNSIDSIVTDPPYELNFMGKGWDNSGIAFQPDTWQKCYEVLKPGGYLLAFGGSRTFHRIACAIEDAGFEIRDTICYMYGSGFPKSMNLSKQFEKKNDKENTLKWQGWGTALKPSFEPIIVARKPFKGSLVDNVIEYGVGGINIDECRVGIDMENDPDLRKSKATNTKIPIIGSEHGKELGMHERHNPQGRFPANTILTYDENDFDEVCGGFPNTKSQKTTFSNDRLKKFKEQDGCERNLKGGTFEYGFNDSGSASRYFYCAKASKKDRDEGLEQFETKSTGELQGGRKEGSTGSIMQNANGGTRVNPYAGAGTPKKNTHPTVKPTALMQYLIRLVTPNGGTILDPFNGSGSTGKAVMYENKERHKDYKYIGIELTEEYLPIAKARIEYVCNLTQEELKEQQMSIFDL